MGLSGEQAWASVPAGKALMPELPIPTTRDRKRKVPAAAPFLAAPWASFQVSMWGPPPLLVAPRAQPGPYLS